MRGSAETDGNRTRLPELLGHLGFEDREGHQAPLRLPADGHGGEAPDIRPSNRRLPVQVNARHGTFLHS
ncbi:hypothetical protein QFZ74_000717 [Streptomyces sp. V3I7]|nr:hypothetical protein [Streptomyces sp. V3I7]